ncbi:MAG: hypothetical protein ACQGQO_02125 [Sphaerochaetaceae bacterium]|nr:SAM-dependent DNA methyltransferase [Candidatus Cloacimonadota bacterium]
MKKSQIKSRDRVKDHGEVFTNEREVKAMCDLVKDETERIDSRFLEPACGNGNFLAEVLSRKLAVVRKRYAKSHDEYERYSFLAVSSIYGVDILEDNTKECRERLYEIWNNEYSDVMKIDSSNKCREAIKFLLLKNIVCGDALTLLQNDGNPITFSEWAFLDKRRINRRDFHLDTMLRVRDDGIQGDLFDSSSGQWDQDMQSYLPDPVATYEPIDYLEVTENE